MKKNENIQKTTSKLTFEERAKLLRLNILHLETTIIDKGNLFESNIYLDDQHTIFTKIRPANYTDYSFAYRGHPLAYIELTDGYDSLVEVIDILETIRNDPTAIGHPVITMAIKHWKQLLNWKAYSRLKSKETEDEASLDQHNLVADSILKSAESNLKAVGEALLEDSSTNTVSKELALTYKVEEFDSEDTFLWVSWDRLSKKNIVETENLHTRIRRVEKYLHVLSEDQFHIVSASEYKEKYPNYKRIDLSNLEIDWVISFLKNEGSKFIFDESGDNLNKRPNWQSYKSAFNSWFLESPKRTIGRSKSKAKNQHIADNSPYTPNRLVKLIEANVYAELQRSLTSSLVKACPSISCKSDIINSPEFGSLLEQALIDTEEK